MSEVSIATADFEEHIFVLTMDGKKPIESSELSW